MGTVSNSLSSSLSSITNPVTTEGSSGTGGIFTGTSQFSSEFQSEITREVEMASLPIEILQNHVTTLQSQSSALTTLNTDFTSLQTAVAGIASAIDGSSDSADISNTNVVSATLGSGATQGVYNIQVVSPGAYQTSLSTATWNSSGSTPNQYKLVIGGTQSYTINSTDNSAQSVANAINAQYGNLVQATAVNVGSATSPDERISLQSATLSSATVDIQLNGQSLQTQQTPPGAPAQYIVNNSGNTVTSDTDTVTISNGVTLTLLGTGSSSITVTQPISSVGNALQSFVTAYNQCATDLNAQRGQSGGALQGQFIVNELQEALNSLAGYFDTANPSGAVNSLSSLGVTMPDTTGQMSFDELSFASTALINAAAVNAFLGSATGGGFLETATNTLNNLLAPGSGVLPNEQSNNSTQVTNLQTQISTDQANVSTLQTQLTNQMAQADASIAGLEQQYSSLLQMFSAQQTANMQYANGA